MPLEGVKMLWDILASSTEKRYSFFFPPFSSCCLFRNSQNNFVRLFNQENMPDRLRTVNDHELLVLALLIIQSSKQITIEPSLNAIYLIMLHTNAI